ncbi:FEKKY domain-containing protein [Chryseobacterium sp.]|uniref:FEKKY domain-containing protein n=1 Tax=Chryseobacterium sp. TaxID=1871047 RepID=UPI002FCB0370
MNIFKTVSLLIFTATSISISAQQYEPLILEAKKGNEMPHSTNKNEKGKYIIQFGMMSQNHNSFKEKYGVNVLYENCVITPFMSEKAKKNNQEVAQYLNKKYGESWKKDLEIIPYGL